MNKLHRLLFNQIIRTRTNETIGYVEDLVQVSKRWGKYARHLEIKGLNIMLRTRRN